MDTQDTPTRDADRASGAHGPVGPGLLALRHAVEAATADLTETPTSHYIERLGELIARLRESEEALAWAPPAHSRYFANPENLDRFRQHHLLRRDTARFRLAELLPLIPNGDIPQGLSHEDPDVRRTLLLEWARRLRARS